MSVEVKYKTSATAIGGRDGRIRTDDGRIDLQLAVPRELGGRGGEGTNPEQLFAAGYAACFLSAVKAAGQQLKVRIPPEAGVTLPWASDQEQKLASASPPNSAFTFQGSTRTRRRRWRILRTRSARTLMQPATT